MYPNKIDIDDGVTEMDDGAASTVRLVVEEMAADVAVMIAVPGPELVARP